MDIPSVLTPKSELTQGKPKQTVLGFFEHKTNCIRSHFWKGELGC